MIKIVFPFLVLEVIFAYSISYFFNPQADTLAPTVGMPRDAMTLVREMEAGLKDRDGNPVRPGNPAYGYYRAACLLERANAQPENASLFHRVISYSVSPDAELLFRRRVDGYRGEIIPAQSVVLVHGFAKELLDGKKVQYGALSALVEDAIRRNKELLAQGIDPDKIHSMFTILASGTGSRMEPYSKGNKAEMPSPVGGTFSRHATWQAALVYHPSIKRRYYWSCDTVIPSYARPLKQGKFGIEIFGFTPPEIELENSELGVVEVDEEGRVLQMREKPEYDGIIRPASLGHYSFSVEAEKDIIEGFRPFITKYVLDIARNLLVQGLNPEYRPPNFYDAVNDRWLNPKEDWKTLRDIAVGIVKKHGLGFIHLEGVAFHAGTPASYVHAAKSLLDPQNQLLRQYAGVFYDEERKIVLGPDVELPDSVRKDIGAGAIILSGGLDGKPTSLKPGSVVGEGAIVMDVRGQIQAKPGRLYMSIRDDEGAVQETMYERVKLVTGETIEIVMLLTDWHRMRHYNNPSDPRGALVDEEGTPIVDAKGRYRLLSDAKVFPRNQTREDQPITSAEEKLNRYSFNELMALRAGQNGSSHKPVEHRGSVTEQAL